MRLFILTALCALTLSCTESARPVAQNSNAAMPTKNSERPQTAIAHGPQEKAPDTSTGTKSKWTQGGDPIDTKELDASIASAEKALSAKPADAEAKKALGAAYYDRAVALTDVRQYASALGDYRRTLKYDPANAEAKEWIERIVSIYDSINRESPKEGEEPPPLPFK
jgi:tetratricopeptide (TPR) repeat protein